MGQYFSFSEASVKNSSSRDSFAEIHPRKYIAPNGFFLYTTENGIPVAFPLVQQSLSGNGSATSLKISLMQYPRGGNNVTHCSSVSNFKANVKIFEMLRNADHRPLVTDRLSAPLGYLSTWQGWVLGLLWLATWPPVCSWEECGNAPSSAEQVGIILFNK